MVEYCAPVWRNSAHTNLVDVQLNNTMRTITGSVRCTRTQGRRSGQESEGDELVRYPTFCSWGLGGAVSHPAGSGAESRRQTHFGTNVLKINSKSCPFSVAVYTPNSDPISDVHWLLQRKISVVRGCEKKLVDIRKVSGCSTSRMTDPSGIILVVVRMAAPLAAR